MRLQGDGLPRRLRPRGPLREVRGHSAYHLLRLLRLDRKKQGGVVLGGGRAQLREPADLREAGPGQEAAPTRCRRFRC